MTDSAEILGDLLPWLKGRGGQVFLDAEVAQPLGMKA